MQRTTFLRRHRIAALLGVIAVLGSAVAASSVVFADSPTGQIATSQSRGLDAWFSVTRTGAPLTADTLSILQGDGSSAGAPVSLMPSVAAARQTAVGSSGEQAIVSADDSKACLFLTSGGGGCWVVPDSSSVRAAPVLVVATGPESTVKQAKFMALVGDGISEITVTLKDGGDVRVPVTNNVAVATVPGPVASWQWQDPASGAQETQTAP